MSANKGKNILIEVSSSSSLDNNGDDVDISSDTASSSSGDEDFDEEEEEEANSSDDDSNGVEVDEVSLENRVTQFLQGRRDLQELSINACKAYLRKHGLRVSGNKDECVRRVKEHWRIKDGKAEILYPPSSFAINCTGDVCKGDMVLFKQKVYRSFDKVTRRGKHLGKRTVAGRVVKESYGAAKQQHTFTVEVLWSKGIKKLATLFPLLVKGRNLYRLKTYRQPWKNEGERRKVLAEKHRRGAVARNTRAKRKNDLPTNKGGKSQKISHYERKSQMSYPKQGRHVHREERASPSTLPSINRNNQQHNVKQRADVNTTGAKSSKTFLGPQKLVSRDDRISAFQSSSQICSKPLVGPYHRTVQFSSHSATFQDEIPYFGRNVVPAAWNEPYHRTVQFGSHSATFQDEIPYFGRNVGPAAWNETFYHRSTHDHYGIQPQWANHFNSRQFIPSRNAHGQWTNGLVKCSIRGCYEPGSNACAISACWGCCQRLGMACNVHR